MVPQWLGVLSWVAIAIGFACAGWLAIEQIRRPQMMWIMNLVWPITGLYMGPIALWAYYRLAPPTGKERSFWDVVFVGSTHCGAGCTLGDVFSEFATFFTGLALLGNSFESSLVMDYIAAYVFGIGFQYYSIVPMSDVPVVRAIWRAMKVDTVALTAFEIGLFGWMAISHFFIFHPNVQTNNAAYWFMMQIGMCIGFATTYPTNWWLIKKGIKGAM